jgi:hypothetical protein
MLLFLIVIPGMLMTVWFMAKYVCPRTNKFFALIWNERDDEKLAVAARIKELYVDGDVPEETALMMAAAESGQSKESILNAFDAVDASDLAKIMRQKPRTAMNIMTQMLDNGYKKGMK